MLDKLRQAILAISAKASEAASRRDIRRLAVLALRARDQLPEHIEGIQTMVDRATVETSEWATPEMLRAGGGGRFDAGDLRHWLALAQNAGVEAVPARPILTLSEGEIEAISGITDLPDHLRDRVVTAIRKHLPAQGQDQGQDHAPTDPAVDPAALAEKLAAALDDVPEGWMVRSNRCGPSTLKTLAGVGAAGPAAPETRFGPTLEIGPGWIRRGNRRMVDAGDPRIVEMHARGPGGDAIFLARPWIQAARFTVTEDPHRRGSQFAGRGLWPAEWRAFVEKNEVVGVSYYYPWAGEISPENAAAALRVRRQAERLVAQLRAQKAIPSSLDVELVRDSPHFGPILAERFPRDAVACSMDFIETTEGLKLLEAGPPFTPVGGGHPCGFASRNRIEGVAFRCVDGVVLPDQRTWKPDLDASSSILSWADTFRTAETAACP